MSTLMLAMIGITLAALAALMTVFYGGTSYTQARINAEASRLTVEGSQIERSVGVFDSQEGHLPGHVSGADPFDDLVAKRMLTHRPPGAADRWYVDYHNGIIRSRVGAASDPHAQAVCAAARRQQGLPDPETAYACDGSDYPRDHPAGTLPENEPCCVFG